MPTNLQELETKVGSAKIDATTTNEVILDKILLNGSNDYQQRVPSSTQRGIEETMSTLNTHDDLYNEFVNSLVNIIGTQLVRSKVWTNPMAKLKRINLSMHKSIEEVGFELVKAKGYNPEDNDIFERNDPRASTAFHHENRRDRYDTTINRELLMKAFTRPTGLVDFLTAQINNLRTSDNHDEYQIMKQLMVKYNQAYGFYNVNVPALTATNKDTVAKDLSEAIRTYNDKLTFLNNSYTAYGVPTFTEKGKAYLITTPEYKAMLDVRVLADAFNMEKADVQDRIILVDSMPLENTYALLVDEDWFVMGDTLLEMISTDRNPKSLEVNYYLHHWSVLSVSPMMNAIAFSTDVATGERTVTATVNDLTSYIELHDVNDNVISGIMIDKPTFLAVGLGMSYDENNPKLSEYLRAAKIEVIGHTRGGTAVPLNGQILVNSFNKIMLSKNVEVGDNISFRITSTYESDGFETTGVTSIDVNYPVIASAETHNIITRETDLQKKSVKELKQFINSEIGELSKNANKQELINIIKGHLGDETEDVETEDVETEDVETEDVETEDVETEDVE